uniref:BHLH domain-containing protein n=1 Tax=Sparus aurata TaxID=8175 RepID=A0A671UAA6_SPAAU
MASPHRSASSDCPSTWTPHTSTPCTARVYLTHGYRISPFTDSSACVITPSSLRSSAKGAAPVRCVNEGRARLRKHLPQELKDKRLSKVETLRVAIYYINVEPAGLVSGWRCHLDTRLTAPLQQRSECSNDGEYSLKLAQPYKSPGPNISLRRPWLTLTEKLNHLDC